MPLARRSTTTIARPAATSSARQASFIRILAQLRTAEAQYTRCPLYQFATQVVPPGGPPGRTPDAGRRAA
jgi:hypothetical protein